MEFYDCFKPQISGFRQALSAADIKSTISLRRYAGYREQQLAQLEAELTRHQGEKYLFFLLDGSRTAASNGPSTVRLVRLFDSQLPQTMLQYTFERMLPGSTLPALKPKRN